MYNRQNKIKPSQLANLQELDKLPSREKILNRKKKDMSQSKVIVRTK